MFGTLLPCWRAAASSGNMCSSSTPAAGCFPGHHLPGQMGITNSTAQVSGRHFPKASQGGHHTKENTEGLSLRSNFKFSRISKNLWRSASILVSLWELKNPMTTWTDISVLTLGSSTSFLGKCFQNNQGTLLQGLSQVQDHLCVEGPSSIQMQQWTWV